MTQSGGARPKGGMAAAWAIVVVLLVLYVVSYMDRTVMGFMVIPIERDLGVSEFTVSLLLGPSFSVFYVLAGLFMGWLVDRFPRRWIIAAGVTTWGAATMGGGLASNFAALALSRTGVGVGESVLTPAAHALIAESFPPKRLSTAMSVYTMGAVIGGGIGMVVSGLIVHAVAEHGAVAVPVFGIMRGWQAVFLAIGELSLALMPLIFVVHEPRATHRSRAVDAAAGQTFLDLVRRHWRLYILLPVGFGCTNIIVGAYLAFTATFMIRTYGVNAAEAGLALGIQNLIAGLIGQVGGAMVVDWLYARGVKDAHTRFQVLGLAVSLPLMLVAFHAPNAAMFLACSSAFYCLTYPYVAYAGAALQLFSPTRLRGRVSALFLAIVGLLGAVGAPAAGALTDGLFHDRARVGDSLSIVTVCVAPFIVLFLHLAGRAMHAMAATREAA